MSCLRKQRGKRHRAQVQFIKIFARNEIQRREENNFEFEFENDNFPDTDSVVKEAKIFDESTAEPDAAVEVSREEVDELELDEGNKSN